MFLYSTYTDQELLSLMQKDDERAFTALFDRYHRPLFLNIMRVIRNTVDAEDILQEVFFAFWQKRRELAVDQSIGGWLFTLSYNRTVDAFRKDARKKKLHSFMGEDALFPESNAVRLEEQYLLLENAVSLLSPQKKKIFQYCKLKGKSYAEAASELGISKYTVGEYLKEAMAFIREYVRRHPVFASIPFCLGAILTFLS